MNYKDSGYVLSYDNDPFKLTPIHAPVGSLIEWKRNGKRGFQKAAIIWYDINKPEKVLVVDVDINWGTILGAKNKWINKNSILKVKK